MIKVEKGFSSEEIAFALEEEIEHIEKIVTALNKTGSKDPEEIYRLVHSDEK